MPEYASKLFHDARFNPVRITLEELLKAQNFDPDKDVLRGVLQITAIMDDLDLELMPSFEESFNDLKKARILQSTNDADLFSTKIKEIIDNGGENPWVELKRSIYIDTKKKKYNPEMTLKDLYNEDMVFQVSKEISAFLNNEGGKLLFGVADEDLRIVGCQDDIDYLEREAPLIDKVNLIFKKIFDQNFSDPAIVKRFVKIETGVYKEVPLVLLTMSRMDSLALLKNKQNGKALTYLRIHESTHPITIENIEKFYKLNLKG